MIPRDRYYQVQAKIGQFPGLYYPLFARKYPFNQMKVDQQTDLCIEGFPRSANSYAVIAFKLDNKGVKMGHHLHAPAQIISACRRKIPSVVVIRRPEQAVASFMVFQNSQNADLYLKLYNSFYKSIWAYRDQFIIADFSTIITDFNKVIDALNERYKKSYNTIDNLADRRDEIFEKLRDVNKRFFAGDSNTNMYPDDQREQRKKLLSESIARSPKLKAAEQTYTLYRSIAISNGSGQ